MKISYDDIRKENSLFDWFFIHAITLKDKQSGRKIINSMDRPKDGKWDIKLTIEGIELPLLKTFKDLEKQDDRRIKEKAVELIQEKLNRINETLMDHYENMENEVKKIISDKNIESVD
ncbi:hypothetical protein LCGC14_0805760 [marine sediment metagenome]|uniref:Uncharacterized protein n=1 Tax=marine sediment metagenome TaxID=412755 RepID=A0A0F9Q892_9ZZZZ